MLTLTALVYHVNRLVSAVIKFHTRTITTYHEVQQGQIYKWFSQCLTTLGNTNRYPYGQI